MVIFDKDILIKSHGCNIMDEPGRPVIPSVNLFVKVTNRCNARCQFCSNANAKATSKAFNIVKLMEVIHELNAKNICVNRLNITGGEPSVVSPLVLDIIESMHQESFDDVHLHLNNYKHHIVPFFLAR